MSIEWINPKEIHGTVTFYDSNITLNKTASEFFNDAYKVLVGIDRVHKHVVIKHINKEEALRGDIIKSNLLDISIKASYGRINSKKVVNEIADSFNFNFKNTNNYKFKAIWKSSDRILEIDLNEEV
ncbi:conserved hypothetical protein [Paracholeplasma brassicae]|uniref:Uncharacterized protein n=1 Tax=Acholeplasma brassicae TaxID=61635 RepID=U4KMY9_9MOLU|nr:hypothetical protein [Paracholeplasma brassicae]CCV65632.1 conserved hypothetical protein [Paracholeplasma brassicae]